MTTARQTGVSLTHFGSDKLSKADIATELDLIKKRLSAEFESDQEQLKKLNQTLNELSEFELGRFLIKNKSLSGYWTWYIILGFNNDSIKSPLEKFIVERAPTILATQQRFAIFQSLLMKHIQSNSVVCSLPCGMMADLLTLNLSGEIAEVRFVGIDLDKAVFDLAKGLAAQLNVRTHCEFFQKDAWDLGIENEFDVIASNGLNIYEKDDSKVVTFYKGMYRALKANGYLICSALTPPPTIESECEWDIEQINKDDLITFTTIFKTILRATWFNFRSSAKTCDQLKEAGFDNIEIHWDKQKMFPTFLARKKQMQLA